MTTRITQATPPTQVKTLALSTIFHKTVAQHPRQSDPAEIPRNLVVIRSMNILDKRNTWMNSRKLNDNRRSGTSATKMPRKNRLRKSVLPKSKLRETVDKRNSRTGSEWSVLNSS